MCSPRRSAQECPLSCTYTTYVIILNLIPANWAGKKYHIVFIYIAISRKRGNLQMFNDYLFLLLLIVNFLSVFLAYFSVGVFIFILLNRQLSLYMKDITPLSAIYILQMLFFSCV